jgi:uncharacterized protein (TIGR02145 family)/uncharacterized repeat protein (TIGR02543 family)
MVLRLLFTAFLLLLGCGGIEFSNPTDPYNISRPSNIAYKSFTDARDGQTYKSVVIGTQTWMAENLNYKASGSFCLGNVEGKDIDGKVTIKDTLVSDGGYCDIYGRLYDWATAKTVCPSGWHLPNNAEWNTLINFAGSDVTKLRSASGWKNDYDQSCNGTDNYGFSALPGSGNNNGHWWSASEYGSDYAYGRNIYCSSYYGSGNYNRDLLFSIRCVKGEIPYNTVTFNANGATSGNVPAEISVVSGDAAKLPEQGSLLKTGYVFNGWNTNNSGTGTKYEANFSLDIASDIILYANWVPIRTVTFDGNNATSGTAPFNMTAGSGFSITLPQQGTLEKNGYLFAGWNADNSGEGTNYRAGSSYSVKDDITLYAIWGVPCTITFAANGGGTAPESIATGSGASVQLPSMSRSGYTFEGWNTNSSGTGTKYGASSYYAVTEDVTLYAMWKSTAAPLGSIKITNSSKTAITRITIGSTTYSGVSAGGSTTINISAGTYKMTAYFAASGGTSIVNSRTVTVSSGATTTVTF